MNLEAAFDKLVSAHGRYYDLIKDHPVNPFDAEAIFFKHDLQYLLTKRAKITEYDMGEYVFFAKIESLNEETLSKYVDEAWSILMERVNPTPTHRNTDVVIYILTENTDYGVDKAVRKTRRYKSYKYGLHGFSHLKLVVYDISNGNAYFNRVAHDRRKVIDNIFKDAD